MYIYSEFQYIGMHICHNYSSSTISLSLGGKYMKLKQLLFICRRQFSNQSVPLPNTVELDMTLQIVKTNRHADFNLKKMQTWSYFISVSSNLSGQSSINQSDEFQNSTKRNCVKKAICGAFQTKFPQKKTF